MRLVASETVQVVQGLVHAAKLILKHHGPVGGAVGGGQHAAHAA